MARVGSLHNLIADGSDDAATPEVGMGATVVMWTDRHAATIVEVSRTAHKVVVQYDRATRTDKYGMSDAQSYEYEADPNGRTETYSRRKDGSYRIAGGQGRLLVGVRSHYHDFGF